MTSNGWQQLEATHPAEAESPRRVDRGTAFSGAGIMLCYGVGGRSRRQEEAGHEAGHDMTKF